MRSSLDLEQIPPQGRCNSGNYHDLYGRGGRRQGFDVSWLSLDSPQEFRTSSLWLFANPLQPPRRKSLSSGSSCCISLFIANHKSAAVETSSLHNSTISH